jgi:aminoglycoside phosphotransferase (APT) family kinase protein
MDRAGQVGQALAGWLAATGAVPEPELTGPLTPLGGGFDTEIYAFRLRRPPAALDGGLVLRMLRRHHDPTRVLREQATQNAVAVQGYPAPRVLLACVDPGPLGAAFCVMQQAPGVPLLSRVVGMAGVLVQIQLRLHALDPTPLGGTLPDLDRYLDDMARRIEAATLAGLTPLLGWLRRRRPTPAGAAVICHGDLHPQNVLVDGGAVSAVLDWPNAVLAERAFDVAATLNILRFVPAGLAAPGRLRWLARLGQPLLAARYLSGYRRRRPIEPDRLAYYEVAAAMRALVHHGEVARGAAGGPLPSALERSPYAARLLARAARITGLTASLP